MSTTIPLSIESEDAILFGILDIPEQPKDIGVLVVVGGPQYRVGSHRQFVLLARALAARGFATLRFDHAGIGDSSGEFDGFEHLEADVKAAIDRLVFEVENVTRVAIWGLCDAASAAMMYAPVDSRVDRLILLNPWVRSEQGLARTYVRQYYFSQITSSEFWRKLLRGEINILKSLVGVIRTIRSALFSKDVGNSNQSGELDETNSVPFQKRMLYGLQKFKGQVLFILSGDDITAAEFDDLLSESRSWREIVRRGNTEVSRIQQANHTFSKAKWRDQVASWTIEWLEKS